MASHPDANLLDEQILHMCKAAVYPRDIHASCLYGPRVYEHASDRFGTNVLLVISDCSPRIMSFAERRGSTVLSILAIDKKTFENDVEKGALGELATETITLPYRPLKNAVYLREMEVKIRKRFVVELLKNVVRQYPEMSVELLIQPEYFFYEVLRRRVRLFPPSAFSISSVLSGRMREQNVNSMMDSYLKALKELEIDGHLTLAEGYVRVDKSFIETTRRACDGLVNIPLSIRKALLPYLQGISRVTNALLQSRRPLQAKPLKNAEKRLLAELEETERYISMPTPFGPVPLSDRTGIQEYVRKTMPGGEELKIQIEQMGGVLNSVFQVRIKRDHEAQRIVVKKYEDWMGFKWFPLALWALGTHSYAVLGATRLEREYAASQFLQKNGFHVPSILHVSLKARLIFREFVEGEKTSELLKRVISTFPKGGFSDDIRTISSVGMEIARIHLAGIALGDCKPENIIVSRNRQVCFLDLEQAERNGSQPWDIAEFLYYSGHYVLPFQSDEVAKAIASCFVEGYLKAGGKPENVKKAASAKYTKVFSIFTLPHIIVTMANVCKNMGSKGCE